jgi:hypothetical protein
MPVACFSVQNSMKIVMQSSWSRDPDSNQPLAECNAKSLREIFYIIMQIFTSVWVIYTEQLIRLQSYRLVSITEIHTVRVSTAFLVTSISIYSMTDHVLKFPLLEMLIFSSLVIHLSEEQHLVETRGGGGQGGECFASAVRLVTYR